MADTAQAGIHDGLRVDTEGPGAVIFNADANADDLVSYAHGQVRILIQMLIGFQLNDELCELSYALRGIIEPAETALEHAARRMRAKMS